MVAKRRPSAFDQRQSKFVALVAEGVPPRMAYMRVYKCKLISAGPAAHRLIRQPHIAERLAQLREMVEVATVMNMRERREILAAMARTTPLDLVDDDGRLLPKEQLGRKAHAIRKFRSRRDPDGDVVTEIETVDRLAAIREDAILAGERSTDTQVTDNSVHITLAQIIASLPPSVGLPRYEPGGANGYPGGHPVEIGPSRAVPAPPVRLLPGETNGGKGGNGHKRTNAP
jgi:hypothetical protein